ncbi:MAG: AAA family ATPase [Gammaproteobacteria bacterium]|nr:AAA family ATPase [Gammaproteobacteria bacterium]
MFIHRVKLRNLLSFGPESQQLELKPLNVLIGPNGAGKSNLMEAVGLLKAVPGRLIEPIIEGGGMGDWIWRGEPKATAAEVEAVLAGPNGKPLRYRLVVAGDPGGFRIAEERLEDEGSQGRRVYLQADDTTSHVGPREVGHHTQQSVLATFKHPDHPELEHLSNQLTRIALFREWSFGRNHPVRMPQKPDLPNDFLMEDARNLGLVLNQLMREYDVRNRIVEALQSFYEGVRDYHVDIQYGTVQTFLREGKMSVPATRLSDGTLRYLCLLTILCHPNPPPLICLEEPELGLHPDVLPDLVELMRKASDRCQLVVTTHSDVIVDALTDTPDSVVVCEKHDGSTTLKRLDASELGHWLDDYRLGELWSSGELGGNRW